VIVLLVATTLITVAMIGALIVVFRSGSTGRMGPPWIWRLGILDPFRLALFRDDGSPRAYTRVLLSLLLVPALAFSVFLWVTTLAALITK
jgi:hypothetical protein